MSNAAIAILIGIAIIIVVLLVIAFLLYQRRRRTDELRSQFGPEYSRTVLTAGSRTKAEQELLRRKKRAELFDIRPLSREEKTRYVAAWQGIQAEFVDNPTDAVTRADGLLGEVMVARGYPVRDFEQQSADLSVDHPAVVQNYRAAHEIAVRHQSGEVSTEELRQAMIHYRALFEELASETEPAPVV
jgi:hypothetical protein